MSRKVNEGDKMKTTFDLFEKKLMRATKKQAKKHSWKNVFLSPEINCFFRENRQQSNARAGEKKTTIFLVMRCLNLMPALV